MRACVCVGGGGGGGGGRWGAVCAVSFILLFGAGCVHMSVCLPVCLSVCVGVCVLSPFYALRVLCLRSCLLSSDLHFFLERLLASK